VSHQTQLRAVGDHLTEHRAGTRGLSTYAKLAAKVGNDLDRHAAINAAQRPSVFDVITGTAGKGGGPVHIRADRSPMIFDDASNTAGAIVTAARLCGEQVAHCALLIPQHEGEVEMKSCLFILAARYDGRMLLTLDDVCDAIGAKKRTAYNQLSAGTFPVPMRKEGKNLICDIRDVAEYLDSQREAARKEHQLSGSVRNEPHQLGNAHSGSRFRPAAQVRDALEAAARLCDEQAAEWDSDELVSDKNYAAHCAALIRAMGAK